MKLAAVAIAVLMLATPELAGCEPAADGGPPARIEVIGTKNQTGGDITITGARFRPNIQVSVSYAGGLIDGVEHGNTGYVDANGNVKFTDTVSCKPDASHEDSFGMVQVAVGDVTVDGIPAEDQVAIARISAAYWVCV